jgi:hypothetical protein
MYYNNELTEITDTLPLLGLSPTNDLITMLSPGDDDEIEDEDDDWTDIDDEDFEDIAEDKNDLNEMELENDIFDEDDDDHLPEDDF